MVFNANGQGGSVAAPVSDDKNSVYNALNGIQPSNVVDWTPLAETLYEAILHFKGGPSLYNPGTTYVSPIQYRCQKNYVILITDGAPTHDVADDSNSPIIPVIGDYDGDGEDAGTYGDPLLQGSHYLDDVARYMRLNDMRNDLEGRQNVTVYTIGFNPSLFSIDSTLLQSTADQNHGGGKYFYCHNAQSFKIAFQLIIEEILNKSTSFLAPTVPISQLEKTASEDRLYLAMLSLQREFWKVTSRNSRFQPRIPRILKSGRPLRMAVWPSIRDEFNP
jgi:type IV pilus assembly protein PilY1